MKLLLFIIIALFNFNTYSQSTLTSLNFGKNNNFHSTKLVLETTTNTTFYNSSGTVEHTKEITSYNTQNNVIKELRYDGDNNLKQRLTRVYDSTGTTCLVRKFENWHRFLGHTVETTSYNFDSKGFLINITDKDQNGNIFRKTDITNNEKGDPIELIGYVKNKIVRIEKSKYNYEKNEVIIEYYNNNEELITSQTTIIDPYKINPKIL